MSPVFGVLTLLTITPVLSVYVQRGAEISDCSMKCPHTDGAIDLYRQCGDETHLLELWCDTLYLTNYYEHRLHLDTSSGCWSLRDAGKNDSCVYNVWRHSKSESVPTSLSITVLDPVLISTISSNSSRLGEDIAVRVQFSGEEAAVTWEVDGGSLPDRYRMMDDNTTLLIPRAQRDDGGRTLRVRITNPVSQESREYQLEMTDPGSPRPRSSPALYVAVLVLIVLVIILILLYVKHQKKMKPKDEERNEENNLPGDNGGPPSISSGADRPRQEKVNLLLIVIQNVDDIKEEPRI